MRRARVFGGVLCGGLGLMSGVANAQSDDITAQEYRAAAGVLAGMEERDTLLETCPADLFESRITLAYRLFGRSDYADRDACAADLVECAQTCVTRSDPRACLYSATLLEQGGIADLRLSARLGHAMACAGGEAGGCTNRGGGIRNVMLQGDPLSLVPFDEASGCLFRTFDVACEQGDSWGCAMSAQTYAYGEGVAPDTSRAVLLYQRACDLAEADTFPSCQFARRGIASLTTE